MKRILAFPVLSLMLISGCSAVKNSGNETGSETIRILTYNVKNCSGMDGVTDYRRVAEIIRRVDPDVVALQELDSATTRSRGVVVLDTLAKLTGMHQTYGASISYQGGKYGIGVLSREKPSGHKRIPLPGREERRSLLSVEFSSYILGCTHLSLTVDDRLESAAIINSSLAGSSKPVFVAGDLNAVPSSPVMRTLASEWIVLNDTAMYTIPSDKPRKCIDYVLGLKSAGHDLITRRAVVVNEPVASDHRPVWVDVEIAGNR